MSFLEDMSFSYCVINVNATVMGNNASQKGPVPFTDPPVETWQLHIFLGCSTWSTGS